MTYPNKETFYQLRHITGHYTANGPLETICWQVEECDHNGKRLAVRIRGTKSQCTQWLDQRPGSAISLTTGDA